MNNAAFACGPSSETIALIQGVFYFLIGILLINYILFYQFYYEKKKIHKISSIILTLILLPILSLFVFVSVEYLSIYLALIAFIVFISLICMLLYLIKIKV